VQGDPAVIEAYLGVKTAAPALARDHAASLLGAGASGR